MSELKRSTRPDVLPRRRARRSQAVPATRTSTIGGSRCDISRWSSDTAMSSSPWRRRNLSGSAGSCLVKPSAIGCGKRLNAATSRPENQDVPKRGPARSSTRRRTTMAKTTGIRQRGTSWEAFVYDRRSQRKIRRTFRSLSEAKGWRHDAASAVRKGTLTAPTRQTLEQAAETWLEGAKRGAILKRSGEPYKPGVLRGYEADLRRYVLPELGAHQLAQIRRADLQALVDRFVGAGHSASKVQNVVMPIRVLCRHALERDELLVNPTTNLRLPAATGRRER